MTGQEWNRCDGDAYQVWEMLRRISSFKHQELYSRFHAELSRLIHIPVININAKHEQCTDCS
jgi:hypothetical protein